MPTFTKQHLQTLYQPPTDSHKGENGRLLVIGGSQLFHSSIYFSADIASRFTDYVHFVSPAEENNDLVRKKAKANFWHGIVIDWHEVENYIEEDDCILIGPGMVRTKESSPPNDQPANQTLDQAASQDDTPYVVNHLLAKYPQKRWVIDGGALQEVDPKLLNHNHLITPHQGEWHRLLEKLPHYYESKSTESLDYRVEQLNTVSNLLNQVTILQKGVIDIACQGPNYWVIKGGNAGLTKGGTGDVLAGLTAALYCKNDSLQAAASASFVLKAAGDQLYQSVGPNYNASDLIGQIPQTLHQLNQLT